eukprot:4902063-Prorocentrum_lima.AAC.1
MGRKAKRNERSWYLAEFWRSLSTNKRVALVAEYKARGWGTYDPECGSGPKHPTLDELQQV